MASIKTYNPKKVTISLGNHIVTGYAEDGFVSVQANSDGVTKKVGCDGEVVRSISPDDTYNISLTLLQSSATNAFLQNKFSEDISNGNGLFPVLIKDLTGNTVFSAPQAWVVKAADRQWGRESSNRQWNLQTGSGVVVEE